MEASDRLGPQREAGRGVGGKNELACTGACLVDTDERVAKAWGWAWSGLGEVGGRKVGIWNTFNRKDFLKK